jgi:hypothetical protein
MEAPPSASAQHLKVEIDRAALEKIELEKKEIALRIDNLSNWKRKWAQTAISFLVPIATAAIALLAAYADLRSVREERTQLADTERDFEKQKAADYAVTKVNRAIELLGVGQNKAPLGRAAVLDALQDLMRAGAKLPETSVDIIFPLLLDPDPRVAKSAQSILDGSASPNYAKSFANALLVATPPVNYKLASLLMSANLGHQNLGLQGIEWVILRDHSGGNACG